MLLEKSDAVWLFKVWWPLAVFFLAFASFLLVAPFLKPTNGVGHTLPLLYDLHASSSTNTYPCIPYSHSLLLLQVLPRRNHHLVHRHARKMEEARTQLNALFSKQGRVTRFWTKAEYDV
ncbi:hypothetical protein DFJ58DRAFT_821500 [Suillus subalutaceus]|uniref:uncharacterized protein n=1 Tax=Suillus subalutaceus TaxID=48586 RepID=UPI001B87EC3A|nr:uncharacterized protein DFJ58DRAFT_821500 [Suillus subalutaceus]KAG1834332.1 hypothetical protein DFJ58DRAFT_821500 [Suillus subalutaceus]